MFYELTSSMSPNLPSLPTASTSQKVATSSQQPGSNDIFDFFSAIEEEHPTTCNPQISKYDAPLPLSKITNSQLSTGYVQPRSNPFAQVENGQNNYQPPQIALQPTAFIVPQQKTTGFRTEFGWQMGLQKTLITGRRKQEDLEVVASTVASQADILQTHQIAVRKEKEGSDEFVGINGNS
jgi:hypothetical protein